MFNDDILDDIYGLDKNRLSNMNKDERLKEIKRILYVEKDNLNRSEIKNYLLMLGFSKDEIKKGMK